MNATTFTDAELQEAWNKVKPMYANDTLVAAVIFPGSIDSVRAAIRKFRGVEPIFREMSGSSAGRWHVTTKDAAPYDPSAPPVEPIKVALATTTPSGIRTQASAKATASWNGRFYIPMKPVADNEELALAGDRLMFRHGSPTLPASEMFVAHKGQLTSGWVLGVFE
jgi:hypothetical protein